MHNEERHGVIHEWAGRVQRAMQARFGGTTIDIPAGSRWYREVERGGDVVTAYDTGQGWYIRTDPPAGSTSWWSDTWNRDTWNR